MNIQNRAILHNSPREYIISANSWHSRLALVACLVTIALSLYAITSGIVEYVLGGRSAFELFYWFTTNGNFLAVFSAAIIIPYAVEGIRKKYFSYPRWIAVIHYSGMICVTLIIVVAATLISWIDPENAYGGNNLYLHLICPLMVIISFFLVESGYRFSVKEALIACVPAFLYFIIYLIEVFIIGEEKGGWKDMYYIKKIPLFISLPGIILFTLGIAFLIRALYNRLTLYRKRKFTSKLWPKDINPVEINIELFGLGRYMGKNTDKEFIEIPMRLINGIADLYGFKAEDLTRPYIRGFLDSVRDKQISRQKIIQERTPGSRNMIQ